MTYGTRQLLLHDGRTHSGISGVAILIALRIVFVSYVSCFSRLVKITISWWYGRGERACAAVVLVGT